MQYSKLHIIVYVYKGMQLTNMIWPVKAINNKPCVLKEYWFMIQAIVMEITSIVIDDQVRSCIEERMFACIFFSV